MAAHCGDFARSTAGLFIEVETKPNGREWVQNPGSSLHPEVTWRMPTPSRAVPKSLIVISSGRPTPSASGASTDPYGLPLLVGRVPCDEYRYLSPLYGEWESTYRTIVARKVFFADRKRGPRAMLVSR